MVLILHNHLVLIQKYLDMANKALDYINSGSLDHARSNPGMFFDGLATAATTAGNEL